MSDDGITLDFGDGVSALDRLMRSIVMMTDGAIGNLTGLGYRREDIFVKIHDDGLPLWIDLHGECVFTIETTMNEGRVVVRGKWLKEVKRRKRSIFAWLFGR